MAKLLLLTTFILASCNYESGSKSSGLIKNHTPVVNPVTVSLNTLAAINLSNQAAYIISGSCSEESEVVSIAAGSVTEDVSCSGGSFTSSALDLSGEADSASFSITANHMTADTASASTIKDTVAPSINSIAIADGNYPAGNTISLTVNFSEVVIVSGTPEADLVFETMAATPTRASYTSGSNSADLIFEYLTVVGDDDQNGIALSSPLLENGGSIVDAVGNPAILTHSSLSFSNVLVDNTVDSVTITSSPIINIANTTSYTVSGNCSEETQLVNVDIGGVTASDTCAGGTWSVTSDVSSLIDNAAIVLTADHATAPQASTSVLKDTVAPTLSIDIANNINNSNVSSYSLSGSCDEDTATVNISLGSLSNSTTCSASSWSISSWNVSAEADNATLPLTADITDAAGNPATQATLSIIKDTQGVIVTLSSPADLSFINIANDSTTFTITGTCDDATASYDVLVDALSATGLSSINCDGTNFSATIDTTGLTEGAHAIKITAIDSQGNSSESNENNVTKDTVAPSISSNSITDGTYVINDPLSLSVSIDEVVIVTGSPEVALTFDAQSSPALALTYASGSNSQTLVFDYTISNGDNDANGIDLASSLTLGTIEDLAGNPLNRSLATTNFPSVLIEGTVVEITSLINPANATYAENGTLIFQINFQESVNITGNPRLVLDIGGVTRYATYSGGTGSTGIEFTYTVLAGDNDADGISFQSTSIDLQGGDSIIAVSDGTTNANIDFSANVSSLTSVLVDTSSGITPPDQVTGVTTAPTTNNTELSVAWSIPNDNGTAITHYVVQYREQGQSTWNNLNPNPSSNNALISGLTAGITYEIRVAADNGLLGPYSSISTAEIFDIMSLDPVAWLSATDVNGNGSTPANGTKIATWVELTGAASNATEANVANQPTFETNVINGLPAVRFDNHDRGLEGTFSRSNGTDLTFVIVGQFDSGQNDKCLFEFDGGGGARGFFIDRRYASNTNYSPALTKGSFQLWTIQDSGTNAVISENINTQIFNGGTMFNTDFTGTGNYVLGDDVTGGNRMYGYIGEFLIFDRVLTPAELSTLQNYLKNKWGTP
jgi:hypothetical protein